MSRRVPASERVTLEQLQWIGSCLGLALLVHVTTLPLWILVTVAVAAAVRILLAARGRDAPARVLRLAVSLVAIALLFLQFRTFNGLSAGTALLALIAGLKLLETQTRRDIYVIAMIIYFLSLTALLHGESFWLLGYLIVVCWVTSASLLRLTGPGQRGQWHTSLRYAGRILAQALPLALAFWLFFPRFEGPLWHLSDDGHGATTGLGDTMSPGDITDLATSDDVAFRVRFPGPTPPALERYWRGPVLHDFDGHTWRRTDAGPVKAATRVAAGASYRYTVSLEPNLHNWIFALDRPTEWDAPRAFLTDDYMLVQTSVIDQPLDVAVTSDPARGSTDVLSATMRRRDTWLPPDRNPRSLRLAADLRAAHPDDRDYVQAVLDMFHRQPFFYTLKPPLLDDDSVDGFLFDTKRGFCGHYASAFATLMRAAHIPARVVTGYHGGTYNRFADYWILRQSDAHAWNEVWLAGAGWVRFDPTAMIAPERVERGLTDLVSPGHVLTSRWQQRTTLFSDTRLRLDALRLLWRQRILGFNQGSQERLLGWLHIPEPDGQKLALVLATCLILGMAWLTWQVRSELYVRPRDPVSRAYARLCRRLAAVGLPREPHEGAEAFAARVVLRRPDLAAVVTLCRQYSELRYAAATPAIAHAAVRSFVAAVRSFRPRGSRAYS